MKSNLILLILLLLFSTGIFLYGMKTQDLSKRYSSYMEIVRVRSNPRGGYFLTHENGTNVYLNQSFREGSLGGSYRGGGPHAGK